jgi:hypothetical protein
VHVVAYSINVDVSAVAEYFVPPPESRHRIAVPRGSNVFGLDLIVPSLLQVNTSSHCSIMPPPSTAGKEYCVAMSHLAGGKVARRMLRQIQIYFTDRLILESKMRNDLMKKAILKSFLDLAILADRLMTHQKLIYSYTELQTKQHKVCKGRILNTFQR